MPASFELLDAVNTKGVRTGADVAARLCVGANEASAQLREAEREGLVFEDLDESLNVGADFNRQYWRLTSEGREVWERLDSQRTES